MDGGDRDAQRGHGLVQTFFEAPELPHGPHDDHTTFCP